MTSIKIRYLVSQVLVTTYEIHVLLTPKIMQQRNYAKLIEAKRFYDNLGNFLMQNSSLQSSVIYSWVSFAGNCLRIKINFMFWIKTFDALRIKNFMVFSWTLNQIWIALIKFFLIWDLWTDKKVKTNRIFRIFILQLSKIGQGKVNCRLIRIEESDIIKQLRIEKLYYKVWGRGKPLKIFICLLY